MSEIRPVRQDDLPQVVELWKRTRPRDDIDPGAVQRFLTQCPLYQAGATLVAEYERQIVGFIMGVLASEDLGHIPVFFVHPQWCDTHVADRLLGRVLDFFRRKGAVQALAKTNYDTGLAACGYDPSYEDILGVLSRNGFEKVWPEKEEEMDVRIRKDLRGFQFPQRIRDARASLQAQGISFQLCTPEMRQKYLTFMAEHFSGYQGWCARARRAMFTPDAPEFWILAFRHGDIVGFVHCDVEELLGADWGLVATGVREDLRRRKIGSVLVYSAMDEIEHRGAERMWIGHGPYDVYHIVDGEIVYRYVQMGRSLSRD